MRISRHGGIGAVLTVLAAGSGQAQGRAPDHWQVVRDPASSAATSAASDSVFFVSMAPGWHVTMGPGAVLFDPRRIADGRFEVEFEFHLFPGSSNAAAGFFVGGRDLSGAGQRYTAFVIRADGSAAVMVRDGARDTARLPWTPVSAIATPSGNATGRNVLRLAMDSAGVHFTVNARPVHSFAHGELALDGHFGLRVGRDVNVHVTRLDLLQRLAPVPAGK